MSYDISLCIKTGDTEDSYLYTGDWNVTWNLCPMLDEAGVHLRDMHDTSAADAIDKLFAAAKSMRTDPERFRKHNPSNGWGTYEGCLQFVEEFAAACARHPLCRIRIY